MSAADEARQLAAAVVAGVLAENGRRWETLSVADRARVEALAEAVARRLLEAPSQHLAAAERDGDAVRLACARELLGLGQVRAGQAPRALSA